MIEQYYGAEILRDGMGRALSDLAKLHKIGLGDASFLGDATAFGGDPSVIQTLINSGMSTTDAVFIADYDPVDKPTLLKYIATGMGPYDALAIIYGGHYMPNVDNPPLPGYRPPSWAPLPGYPHTTATTATPASTSTAATALPFGIPSTVFGIPTLYVAAAAGLALMLSRG